MVILLHRYRNPGSLLSELRNHLGGEQAEEGKILRKVAKLWGKQVIHMIGPDGRKHEVWKISPGKYSWEYRMIWEARPRCLRKTGVIALPVHSSEDDRPFSLVISRPGWLRTQTLVSHQFRTGPHRRTSLAY